MVGALLVVGLVAVVVPSVARGSSFEKSPSGARGFPSGARWSRSKGGIAARTPRPPAPPAPLLDQHGNRRPATARLSSTPQLPPPAATTTSYIVDTPADPAGGTSCAPHNDHACSLRAAVAAADAAAGVTSITVPAGTHVRLSPALGPLEITHSMFIVGTGASVDGVGSQVLAENGSPVVEITGLEITGADTTSNGGGVYCDGGSLVLSHVDITGNIAADGGGVYTSSGCELWVDDSVVSDNVAAGSSGPPPTTTTTTTTTMGTPPSTGPPPPPASPASQPAAPVVAAGSGGGLYLGGSANITDAVVGGTTSAAANSAEQGAGIYNADGTVDVTGTSVDDNIATVQGAQGVGIYNDDVIQVSHSSVDGNIATVGAQGAGVYNASVLTMTSSAVDSDSIAGNAEGESAAGAGICDAGDTTLLEDVSLIGDSSPVTASAVDGGAVDVDDLQFTWLGGTVRGTTNGRATGSDSIDGGVAFIDSVHATIEGVDISGTDNDALPDGDVYGGAIGVGGFEGFQGTELEHLAIADTTNRGQGVSGGVLDNNESVTANAITITGTTNDAVGQSGTGPASASIYGGVLYSDAYLVLKDADVVETSNLADFGAARGPSPTPTYVEGGDLYNANFLSADGLSFSGTTSRASGGDGYVYGGAIFSSGDPTVLDNTQAIGVAVQADSFVYGGLVENESDLSATNFTLGDSSVRVLGGPDAGTPYADGTILDGDGTTNIVNGTFAGIVSTVPSDATYAWGIENDAQLQLSSSTLADDSITGPRSGGGTWLVWADQGSQMGLRNTIVDSTDPAENCAPSVLDGGVIGSSDYNIDSGHSCGFTSTGDRQDTDPLVMPLAPNGGAVETAALTPPSYGPSRAGSPAIDAGTNLGCPPYDARGVTRPQARTCDIGAYEVAADGYWVGTLGGGMFHFGAGIELPSVASLLAAHRIGPLGGPIVAAAAAPDHRGYWQVGADGGVFAFGTARFEGSLARTPLTARVVAIAATDDDGGYWLVEADGRVSPFGDARNYGGEDYAALHERVVAIAATPDAGGYWLVTANGAVLPFGDAVDLGSPARSGLSLAAPLVGIATTPDGKGYWLVGADGGVFGYGDARYHGGTGGKSLTRPVVGVASTPDGLGYWLFDAGGAVIPFGDAQALGSPSAADSAPGVSAGVSSNY